MSSPSDSSYNHDDMILDVSSSDESKFYHNMRTADKRLTELLANGHAFSKGGDEILPIGPGEMVATPFGVSPILDGKSEHYSNESL